MSSAPGGAADGGRKKQLQALFERANKLMMQGNHDYANELLSQCVLGDPSNSHYAVSFLANLRQKYNNNKKGSNLAFIKGATSRGVLKKASMQKDHDSVIKHGLELLKLNPWDVGTLTTIAGACSELNFDDAEMTYLKLALEVNPADADVNRLCAVAYKERKQFDEAIQCWRRVAQARKGDNEAAREIHSLEAEKAIAKGKYEDQDSQKMSKKDVRQVQAEAEETSPEEMLERQIKRHPQDVPRYMELAELHLRAQRPEKARDVYARVLEFSPDMEEVKDKLADLELEILGNQLTTADKEAREKGTDEAKQRAESLRKQYEERRVKALMRRVERYPNDFDGHYELGRHYMRSGLYNEAIPALQRASNDPRLKGACLVAVGACFQHKKLYRPAMKQYEDALEVLADRDDEKKEALYLAARLAYGLHEYEKAEKYATALAGIDFAYKEVSTLLDKIAQKREDKLDLG